MKRLIPLFLVAAVSGCGFPTDPGTPVANNDQTAAPPVESETAVTPTAAEVEPGDETATFAVAALPFDFSGGARNPAEARAAQQACADNLGREVVVENSLGIRLVLIPPGRFLMGSPRNERERGGDEDQHTVGITTPFYLGVYEITQEQMKQLIPEHASYFREYDDMDTSRFPAEWLTWNEAIEFCRKLSEMEGETYRLPTEAEWEYACRAGATTPFSFGDQLNGDKANCYGQRPYGTSVEGEYLGRPTDVGSYDPNPFGLYDMHGNVWELCSDWYDESYYGSSPAVDPQGASQGSRRALRGGGWSGGADLCRSADRNGADPDEPFDRYGFRIVMEP